jgi:hypothetical protein
MIETSRPGATGTDSSFTAHMSGNYYAALAPLQTGQNNITAIATDGNGARRDATVTVMANPGPEEALLTFTTPNADFPTLKPNGVTALDVTLKTIPFTYNPIVRYSWDFNGDGVTDLQCNSLSTVTARFKDKGIYLPTVTVTDTLGKKYTDTTIVNVLDKDDDTIFKMIWNKTKTALARRDVDGALLNFTQEAQDMFRFNFDLLRDHLVEISQNMGQIKMIKSQERRVEFELLRSEAGVEKSYMVEFVRDIDGVWRLSFY